MRDFPDKRAPLRGYDPVFAPPQAMGCETLAAVAPRQVEGDDQGPTSTSALQSISQRLAFVNKRIETLTDRVEAIGDRNYGGHLGNAVSAGQLKSEASGMVEIVHDQIDRADTLLQTLSERVTRIENL